MADAQAGGRVQEVWARLAAVTDPELDESVTELGFVSDVTVTGDDVAISFRLPTYWCAANFAFMMTSDLRDAAASLPWVRAVSLSIDAHMYADQINRGMAEGLSFERAFPGEASGDLAAVRLTFAKKAFQRRQETLLRALLAQNQPPGDLLGLTVAALRDAHPGTLTDRYLEKREVASPAPATAAAFVDVDGGSIAPERLTDYLRALRRVTLNTAFNGALCRGLLAARYDEAEREPAGPGLLHFIRQHRDQCAPDG